MAFFAREAKMLGAAFGTGLGKSHAHAAPMAHQRSVLVASFLGVVGHGNTASGARYCAAAGLTAYKVIVSASVKKKYRLLVIFDLLNKSLAEKISDR